MEQRYEGTPQATINLDGRRLTRSEVTNDWGLRLQWEIKRNGQVVATVNARTGLSYEHADTAPGNYEVVLQMWRYVNYAKNPQGEFTASRFIDVSNRVTYSIESAACGFALAETMREREAASGQRSFPMLNIGNEKIALCHGLSRRSFLSIGATALAGMSLPNLMALEAQGAVDGNRARIKNCITIFLVGSPGHLDTWDMKPQAPSEVKGKYNPIQTNVNGIQICEHFPLMARKMDKISLIRSLHHRTGATHENGQRWMMTGHDFNADSVKPHVGSVISRVFGQKSELPANVVLPGPIGNTGAGNLHGQTAGHVGSAHEPFFLNADPAAANFRVADLEVPAGMSASRLDARRDLLNQLDGLQRRTESNSTQMHDSSYNRAFRLLTSQRAKEAFDLNLEAPRTRDRYGRNTFGQSCLMARRLIEGGVRYVTVNHFDTVFGQSCWDMHADGGGLNNTYLDYERHLCPQFDWAFTALIEDLEQKGLLQETVVAVLSEFGRTPRLNGRGGRDHYPAAWTNFLCGGNIRGGQVVGSTDRIGSRPHDNPIEPPQILASIYHGMGINLDTTMMPGPGERPVRLVDAEPIRQLFA